MSTLAIDAHSDGLRSPFMVTDETSRGLTFLTPQWCSGYTVLPPILNVRVQILDIVIIAHGIYGASCIKEITLRKDLVVTKN